MVDNKDDIEEEIIENAEDTEESSDYEEVEDAEESSDYEEVEDTEESSDYEEVEDTEESSDYEEVEDAEESSDTEEAEETEESNDTEEVEETEEGDESEVALNEEKPVQNIPKKYLVVLGIVLIALIGLFGFIIYEFANANESIKDIGDMKGEEFVVGTGKEVLKVGNVVIKESKYNDALELAQKQYAQQQSGSDEEYTLTETDKKYVYDNLISEAQVLNYIIENDISYSDSEYDEWIDQFLKNAMKEESFEGSEKEYITSRIGVKDKDEFKNAYKPVLIFNMHIDKEKEALKKDGIKDSDIKDIFGKYDSKEELSQIIVANETSGAQDGLADAEAKAFAEKLMEELDKGTEFDALVEQHVQKSPGVYGGAIGDGFITVYDSSLDEDVAKEAFSMKKGDYKLVTTDYGYIIIKVNDKVSIDPKKDEELILSGLENKLLIDYNNKSEKYKVDKMLTFKEESTQTISADQLTAQ